MEIEVAPGVDLPEACGPVPLVVGALVPDALGRILVQRRSRSRSLFPGCWDIVGGHVDPGEDVLAALAREVAEETGWRLSRVDALVAAFDWETPDGHPRHEVDYLVSVDGDLADPAIEWDKHDTYRWLTEDEVDVLTENRPPGDHGLRDVVAAAFVRLR